jgi:hypothetical protein
VFRQFISLLLCLNVLACPATCGRCSGQRESATAAAVVCESHCDCGHHATPYTEDEGGLPGEFPQPCRDCFCAGALLPAVDVVQVPDDAWQLSDVETVSQDTSLILSAVDCWQQPLSAKPPSGRAYLTSYCTLLL